MRAGSREQGGWLLVSRLLAPAGHYHCPLVSSPRYFGARFSFLVIRGTG